VPKNADKLGAACLVMAFVFPSLVPAQPRDSAARAEFQRQNPCPANGQRRGPCPGYVVDHIVPLACGGADTSSNMQWQTEADGKAKDRWERQGCIQSML
jgi:hypothetical protein